MLLAEVASTSGGATTATLFASVLAFLGVLATATLAYLGTRSRGPSINPPPPAPPLNPGEHGDQCEVTRRNLAKAIESLRVHREFIIQHDLTPPPYPELES